ncbi:MAG TPA: glycosyltransferase family 4 protein [Sphingomicrobium sp.]|jgi:glycosyltransferase involved in cell wall biosynthesis
MSGLRLLLVTDAVGGVWNYSLELARALKPLGIDTILAVMGPSPSADQRDAAAGIKLIDTGLPLEWIESDPQAIGRAGEELARIAAREHADVVQTCSAALNAEAPFGVPCVAVQHSCVATWWEAVRGTDLPEDFAWRTELVARGLRRAAAVVAPSRAFAAATQRTYDLEEPVIAVHNGRTARAVRALPQGEFVLTAGRLWDEGKDVATLDRAAARIAAPFQAAGSAQGPNGATIALADLTMLGHLSETRLNGLRAARPVFASAALYEPFGLSVLEAAQAGCALVLSDIPTHRELWDGVAMFVEPRDDRAFAETINSLLGETAQRNRMGEAACDRARQYTAEATARGMAAIYERVAVSETQLIAGAA